MSYITEIITSPSTATSGSDYLPAPSPASVTFSPSASDTTKTFDVTIRGDDIPENDETFDVSVSSIDGVAPSPAVSQTVTIEDDGRRKSSCFSFNT